MADQLLAEVHALLSAQAKATGMIAIIDAYTLFQNSDVGPYVGLYNTRRNHREGRVYVNGFDGNGHSAEFRKLPKWLQDAVIQSLAKEPASEAPRSEGREYVEQRRLLRQCQPFKVVRYKYASADENDKEPWRIERCFDIGRPPQQHRPDPTPPPPPPQSPPQQEDRQPASDAKREAVVAELWNLVPTVYKQWNREIAKIVEGVSCGRTSDMKELDAGELDTVRAIILLDKLGMATYGDNWHAVLGGLVSNADYDTVYVMPIAKLRQLYGAIKQSVPQPA